MSFIRTIVFKILISLNLSKLIFLHFNISLSVKKSQNLGYRIKTRAINIGLFGEYNYHTPFCVNIKKIYIMNQRVKLMLARVM